MSILAPNGRPARQQFRAQGMQYAFDAAKRSGYKGFFYFPTLDPSEQFTDLTREDSAKKLNWLYNNVPAASAAIDGLSEEIADTGMWPRATTSSSPFNKAVTDAFHSDNADPRFFDEAGEETFYTAQKSIFRNIFMLHDYFGQFLRPGEGSFQPSMSFLPGWQVGSPSNKARDGKDWIDGTRANAFGRISQYWVYTNKNRSEGNPVLAGDLLHFHDSLWRGQRRGMSPLTSAVRKWFSLDDIDRAATSGELMRTRLAYAITKSSTDDDEPTLIPGATVVETIETDNPDGTKTKLHVQRIVSQDGTDIDIADLPPGRDIKTVESQKGSQAMQWSEHMLTDIARCTKFPPQFVFFLGGLVQGTEVRMVNKRIQRRKNHLREHLLLPQFCQRWYNFWLWQNIARGRFDKVEGGVPKEWYKVRWNYPSDDSVDVAREGRLYDERVESGKMSAQEYHSMRGVDADDHEDLVISERVRCEMKLEDARAKLEGRVADYASIAARIQYDLIFRESKSAIPMPNGQPMQNDNETPPPAKNNGSRNGHENSTTLMRDIVTSLNGQLRDALAHGKPTDSIQNRLTRATANLSALEEDDAR